MRVRVLSQLFYKTLIANVRVFKQATVDNNRACVRHWINWLDLIGVITSKKRKYFEQEPIQRRVGLGTGSGLFGRRERLLDGSSSCVGR